MNEIIQPNNKELLALILGDVQKQSYISAVQSLETNIQNHAEQIDVPVEHHFAPSIYVRQMNAKAGTLVVSKMHRTEHIIIFLTGSVSVLTENGIEHIQAPFIQKTVKGTKRVGYFHEDTSCITIHQTNETDLERIEDEVIVPQNEETAFLEMMSKLQEIEL